MSDQWYVKVGRQQIGPMSFAELQQWASEQRISPQDQVQQAGGMWMTASKAGLFASFEVNTGDSGYSERGSVGKQKKTLQKVLLVGAGASVLLTLVVVTLVVVFLRESGKPARERDRARELERKSAHQAKKNYEPRVEKPINPFAKTSRTEKRGTEQINALLKDGNGYHWKALKKNDRLLLDLCRIAAERVDKGEVEAVYYKSFLDSFYAKGGEPILKQKISEVITTAELTRKSEQQ